MHPTQPLDLDAAQVEARALLTGQRGDSEAQQDPTQDGEAPCGNPRHRAHPRFTCAEVDQTRPFWEGRWADDAVARSGQPETDEETPRTVQCSRAVLRWSHEPHGWYPQPGMDPVDCPGYEPEPR